MMTYIISYRKKSDEHTTYSLNEPDGSTELATIEGVTYVAIPKGSTLGEQPPEISNSIKTITLTPELKEKIKTECTQCQVISKRMIDKIREKYTLDDELFLARISSGALLGIYELKPGEAEEIETYRIHTESVREWGRQERAKIGL